MLQQQHCISTSTNPGGHHMSNSIRQNEVKMANEPLKIQQPLQSSSEMDKVPCITNTEQSPVTNITVKGTSFILEKFE